MKTLLYLFFFLLIGLLFQNCVPSIHVFNATNTPNLTEKKEINVNGYLGTEHVEGQLAFSPAKQIGVIVNSYVTRPTHFASTNGTQFLEGAIGFYKPLKREGWNIDLYAGGGGGQRKYNGPPDNINNYPPGGWEPTDIPQDFIVNNVLINTTFVKTFLQSSIFYKKNALELSFTSQLSYLYFKNLDFYIDYSLMRDNAIFFENSKNVSLFNINTAITGKYCYRHFAFVLQLANNFSPNNPYRGYVFANEGSFHQNVNVLNFDSRMFAVNFGVQFSFGGTEPRPLFNDVLLNIWKGFLHLPRYIWQHTIIYKAGHPSLSPKDGHR